MLVSKPRIDRELENIEVTLTAELKKTVKDMYVEVKRQIRLDKQKHTDAIELQLKENNVDDSKFTTIVLVHVPTTKKLIDLENWLEANITNHVKIQEAVGLEYEDYPTDDEFDYEDEYPDASDVSEVKVDRYANAYGKKEIYKFPTYEFSFVEHRDAVRFKLSCCGN